MKRLILALLGAALFAPGCATKKNGPSTVTVYGTAALAYEGRPANWSVERALENVTDGSLIVDSRTSFRDGKSLSHSLLTMADREGRPIYIEAVARTGSPTVLLIDYAGDAAPLVDAIADSLGQRGYSVDRREPSRVMTASFSPGDRATTKPTSRNAP